MDSPKKKKKKKQSNALVPKGLNKKSKGFIQKKEKEKKKPLKA